MMARSVQNAKKGIVKTTITIFKVSPTFNTPGIQSHVEGFDDFQNQRHNGSFSSGARDTTTSSSNDLPQQNCLKEIDCNNMSFIIDQTQNFFFTQREQQTESSCHSPKVSLGTKKSSLQQFGDILRVIENGDYQMLSNLRDQSSYTCSFLLGQIHKKISAIMTLKINLNTEQITFNFQLLSQSNKYLRVEGRDRTRIMCKYLNSRLYLFLVNEFNLVVSIRNGVVSIKIPVFYFASHFQTKKRLERLFRSIRVNLVTSLEGFNSALQMLSEVSSEKVDTSAQNSRNQLARENFSKLERYSKIMNMFLYICSESTHEEEFLRNQLQREEQSITNLKRRYMPFEDEFASVPLYSHCEKESLSKKDLSWQLSKEEKMAIKSKIELPQVQQSKNSKENNFVLNYIKTKNKVSKCLLKKVSTGGFTSIYLADVQFWYVNSYNADLQHTRQEFQLPDSEKCHRKYLAIKREDRRGLEEGRKSRVAHEKLILDRMKNGVSIFLNKYYLLSERDEGFENDLFSDYIDYPTLYDYCQKNKETLSFQTKIYLSIMIVQSLRYLAEYDIAHLDLKPTNIMTNKKLTIKLIDFGESYFPQLKKHRPGFSTPYSAPENYTLPDTYSYKNDVFSLGVIMHELFLGKYPFYFYDDKLRDRVYRGRRYCDYWFGCSQGHCVFGEGVVFPLVEGVIMRCLHPEPEHRPQLQWIAYILRGCIDYFY